MENGSIGPAELKHDQQVFMVLGGNGEHDKMLVEGGNLVVFESLWHAGPLVRDLQALGISARMVPMMLRTLYHLARNRDLGLWVMRHDGTITAIERLVFP